MSGKPRKNFEEYFWSLVDKSGECWIWAGGTSSDGYGRISRNGVRQGAHRIAYELVNGPIKDGLFACHHCDIKKCVRPSHIFLGTQKDNMQDWTRKGLNKALVNGTLKQEGDSHWTKQPEAAAWKSRISALRKEEIRTGVRQVIRGEKGQIMGHRKTS